MPNPRHLIHRRSLGAALATLAVLALPAPQGAGAAPSIGGFSVRPAESNPSNPATRAYFVQSLARGRFVRDAVAVSNLSSGPLRLRVYPVDGVTGVTSGAVYTNRGVPLRKAGRWLKASSQTITLPAGAERLVSFVVGVPGKATSGDHLAGLAVENMRPQHSRGHFAVTEIFRAVVGVEVQVPGRAGPQLALNGASIHALPGTSVPSVVIDMADAGLKLCKPHLAVTLSGSSGSITAVHRALDTMLPGDEIPYPMPWPRPLASGNYNATAVATGCGHNVTLHRTVSLGSPLAGTAGHPGLGASTTPHGGGGTPWWLMGLIALAGIAGGSALASMAAHRRPRSIPNSG